jgi:4a-hydroxytetrahydrobiopterin dehydratase
MTPEDLASALEGLDGWSSEDSFIVKSVKFSNFAESLAFVNKVGAIAEKADHHPDIAFGWGYADIKLTTHDRGGVTDVDISLARKIDAL